MQANITELSRRACAGEKEAQYALEAAAEHLLAEGRLAEAAAAFKEAAAAFRIAASFSESQWHASQAKAKSLESDLRLLQSWIETRARVEPLPRTDLPTLTWAQFARALGNASDPEFIRIAHLAVDLLQRRGVEFYNPGGSVPRRLGVLLFAMGPGHRISGEYQALLQDPLVRVALDLLADWGAKNLREESD